MTDDRIDAFIGGVIGGFAAVAVTNFALQALEVYQRRQAGRMQPGFAGIGGEGS